MTGGEADGDRPAPREGLTTNWDPDQYARFAKERAEPFFDLLDLVEPVDGGTAVDLGCGNGELTREMHRRVRASATIGVDSSPEMLAKVPAEPGLSFHAGDIGTWRPPGPVGLVFSNAAMHWLPDQPAALRLWASHLAPGGQLAVQVPANSDHASHRVADSVAREEPFRSAMGGDPPRDPTRRILKPEEYAVILDGLGFARQRVSLRVYAHHLASGADVVAWTRGTSLLRFQALLPPELYAEYVRRYRERLLAEIGEEPYLYPFKRILMWACLP